MKKVLQYQVPQEIQIVNENVGSILLHINPQTSGDVVANILDLNKIEFGLNLKRGNREEETIFNGYLGDFLQHLYGGNTKLETVIEKTSIGYLIYLEFTKPINVRKTDVLKVKTNLGDAANSFTSAVTAKSTAILYTKASTVANPQNLTAVYRAYPFAPNETNLEKSIGNNVSKIIFDGHPTSTFDASTDAKPNNVQIFSDNFNVDLSQVEILAENQMGLFYNPDSDVKNLVVYDSNLLLTNARIKVNLDKGAATHTKVLVTNYKIM